MAHRSQISLCKSIFRHHCRRSPIPFFGGAPVQRISSYPPKPNILGTPTSRIHFFADPTRSIPKTHFANRQISREFSGESGELDQNEEVDTINLKFAEAREEIDMAMESKETVYFDEEAENARAAVKEVLDRFESLLARSPEGEKAALQRAMGLKMEQLKAELQQLED